MDISINVKINRVHELQQLINDCVFGWDTHWELVKKYAAERDQLIKLIPYKYWQEYRNSFALNR